MTLAPAMRIVTLSDEEFSTACEALARKVRASGFDYSLIAGIATGGWLVAQRMPSPRRVAVTKRRGAHKARRKLLPALVARLPRIVNDMLRIAESRLYALKARVIPPAPSHVEITPELAAELRRDPRGRILIVDDAVDSGATLLSVAEAVRKTVPEAEIRTAVITVTRPGAVTTPDWSLYPEGTIVRFPWAPDN